MLPMLFFACRVVLVVEHMGVQTDCYKSLLNAGEKCRIISSIQYYITYI